MAWLWPEERRIVSDSQSERFRNSLARRRAETLSNLSEDRVFVLGFSRHRVVRELQSTGERQYSWLIPYSSLTSQRADTVGLTLPKTCTVGQGTGWHGLSLKVLKTGLTRNSTVFSMSMVANHGSRFRFWFKCRFRRAQGCFVRKYTMDGLRGPFVHEG